MITVQILTRNNSKTIEKCLDSAFAVSNKVIVADLGSGDGTKEICISRGAEVRSVANRSDLSKIRNSLIEEGQNLYLEPWEFISRGIETIPDISGVVACYVVQGGFVSKQVRFWNSGYFKNPVFEYLDFNEPTVRPDLIILSENAPDQRKENTLACRDWLERNPTSPDPYYYLACSLLAEGKIDEFVKSAIQYISLNKESNDSLTLINYYLARVEVSRGLFQDASRRALACLMSMPTFAEFWCLLGDMLFAKGNYDKAIQMYENARIIGKRRSNKDMMPIEIAKYGSYPIKMEERCRTAMSDGFVVANI